MDYRLKYSEEQTLYKVFVAENLATMSAGQKYKERMSYTERYNKIWGINNIKDTRSAKQIIDDTFAARGVKVKWHNGESK